MDRNGRGKTKQNYDDGEDHWRDADKDDPRHGTGWRPSSGAGSARDGNNRKAEHDHRGAQDDGKITRSHLQSGAEISFHSAVAPNATPAETKNRPTIR